MAPKTITNFMVSQWCVPPAEDSPDEADGWSDLSEDSLDSNARAGVIYDDPPAEPALRRPRSKAATSAASGADVPEMPDNSDFDLLSTKDYESDFESFPEHQPLAEKPDFDFQAVEFRDAPHSVSNQLPSRTMVESATALAKRAKEVGGSTRRVAAAGLNALLEDVLDTKITDASVLSPARWLLAFATGVASASAVELFGEYQGKSVDHQATIDQARNYLEEGGSAFSRDQKSTVESWIQEASTELERFIAKQHRSITRPTETVPAPAVVAASTSSAAGEKSSESAPVAPAPAVVASQPQRDKGTLGAHVDLLRRAAERRNPSFDILTQEAPELATALQALQNFVTIPYQIQQTAPARVLENSRANPALGNEKFVANLEGRAKSLAEDARKPANEQTKRLLVAASGPGTGKTTSIQKMAQWANLPLCMLTGEAFKRMKIPADSSAFTVFQRWVCEKVLKDFRVDNRGVVNGIILLDDFHFAWEEGGPFSHNVDPTSRNQFFLFLKNMGDANQASIFSIDLAPNREFPLNLSRVQVIITLNNVPPELGEKAEPALRSRLVDLEPDYPTREDRRRIAIEHRLPEIKSAVQKVATGGSLECIDEKLAEESIAAVADADADLIAEKFAGKHGYRGLFELLDRYKAHVLRKLEAANGEIVPALFSLKNGKTPFEPAKVMNAIKDYQCAVDSNMAEVEARAKNEADRGALRIAAGRLNKQQAKAILGRIHANESIKDWLHCEKDLLDISKRLQIYAQMPHLLSREAVGTNITKKFGYFKGAAATGTDAAAASGEGEVDRLGPLVDLLETLYWRRVYARDEKSHKVNEPVRVTFSSPDAFDDGLFPTIGDVLGGLPICRITDPHQLIALEDPYGVWPNHESFKAITELVETEAYLTDGPTGHRCYCRNLEYAGKHYFYYTDGLDAVLLTARGIGEVVKAGKEDKPIQGGDGIGKRMRARADMRKEIATLLKPQVRLFDNILSQGERTPELSVGESLVVVLLTRNVCARIKEWAYLQSNPTQATPMTVFENYLAEQLNRPEIKLPGGGTFDPRGVTVFLLNEPHSQLGEGTALLDWKLGVPPIEGRGVSAWDKLDDKLRDMRATRAEQLQTLGLPVDSEPVELTKHEKSIMNELIKYDRDFAIEAREEGYALPRRPLDDAVKDLAARLKAIKINTFQMERQTFPDLPTFHSAWNEYYEDAREEIDFRRAEKRRLAAEEVARIKAKEAAEQAAIEAAAEQARAPKWSSYGYGVSKAKPRMVEDYSGYNSGEELPAVPKGARVIPEKDPVVRAVADTSKNRGAAAASPEEA